MPSLTTNLWGRQFELEVIYDLLGDEEVSKNQTEALQALTKTWRVVEDSLKAVKQYCRADERSDIKDDEITNIFKYVVPQALYVERSERVRLVGLLCAYRFDPEHNLAILFENEQLKEIGSEDILL